MKKEIYTCDNCGKDMHPQACATVSVYAYQGYPFRDVPDQFDEQFMANHWKHKNVYHAILCQDCIDSDVNFNHGDDPSFGFSPKDFLKKIGVIKSKPIPSSLKS